MGQSDEGEFIRQTGRWFLKELRGIPNLHPLDLDDVKEIYPCENYYDLHRDQMGHVPYTREFFAVMATVLARRIFALRTKPSKVIVLDCDNTLWKGVCGEVGPQGVEIGPEYRYLQEFMIKRHEAGVLLCLASKNSEADVRAVFEENRDMALTWEHITAAKVNWQPKSSNIRQLARELNLGSDSFVFLDDNPVECAEVRSAAQEVLTLQLPEEGAIRRFLDHSWCFDVWDVTDADKKRARFYKQNQEREQFKRSSVDFKEFLNKLNLNIQIAPMGEEHLPRVSQLTIRTNQFNFTTIRRKENDIQSLLSDGNHGCHVTHVDDRFGDYGLVGVFIYKKEKNRLAVDTFLLSCRVLGRGVEHRMVAELGRIAQKHKKKKVVIKFSPTEKNEPAKHFLDSFSETYQKTQGKDTHYLFPTDFLANYTWEIPESDSPQKRKTAKKTSAAAVDAQEITSLFQDISANLYHPTAILAQLSPGPVKEEPEAAKPASRANRGEALGLVSNQILTVLSSILGVGTADIDAELSFKDLGVKSMEGISLIAGLNEAFDIVLPITILFDYANVGELVDYILKEHQQKVLDKYPSQLQASAAGTPTDDAVPSPRPVDPLPQARDITDIAVIGLAGRFPGATGPREFWDMLTRGKSAVSEVSPKRWDPLYYYSPDPDAPGKTNCKWGGFLEDIDCFDPLFFSISGKEASKMDPQQRIFLEECWNALEDAGYAGKRIASVKCGIFAATGQGDYRSLLRETGQGRDAITFTGNHPAILASRLSYYLDLKGPSLVVETACSSSLVAVHYAAESIRSGDSDVALAGGVFVNVTPEFYIMATKAGMLSPKGRCNTFSDDADGFVPGEAAGVVVLKEAVRARMDGDHIYGCIKSSAVNQDGKTNGIMAPSTLSQTDVESACYQKGNIDAADIGYVEAHGTGTKLGDPIEIEALTNAWRRFDTPPRSCPVGSVKTNIGHAANAAGIASLIKALLSLKYKMIPPSLNFSKANSYISFEDSPFYVNTELLPWRVQEGKRRMAAVSSFGFSGTNCHVVVEEYAPPENVACAAGPYVFVLSAKNRDRLQAHAAQTAAFLRETFTMDPSTEEGGAGLKQKKSPDRGLGEMDISLADVVFTSQVGREPMAERIAVIVDSVEELIRKLTGFAGGDDIPGCFTGNVKESRVISELVNEEAAGETFVNSLMRERQLKGLARLWVTGVEVDWKSLYCGASPRMISMPTYPFARQRYWVEGGAPAPVASETDRLDGFFYLPRWVKGEQGAAIASPGPNNGSTLVVFPEAAKTLAGAINSRLKGKTVQLVSLKEMASQQDFAALLSKAGAVGAIYFLGGVRFEDTELCDAGVLGQTQQEGIYPLFRLTKALIAAGRADSHLEMKVVTNRALAVTERHVFNPFAAALHGLSWSMKREFPHWRIQCIDVDLDDVAETARQVTGDVYMEQEDAVAYRSGARYHRIVEELTLPPASNAVFRRQGVYLILGGTGGIGLTLAQYLAKTYGARLVLVDRNPLDKEKKEAVSHIESLGGEVLFMEADATRADQLRDAVQTAKKTFGAIHGAFHSAIVLRDKTIENMDEEILAAALDPKTKATLALFDALKDESLDFMLLLSSAQSFYSHAGQANYTAGCTFKDAVASAMDRVAPFPVKVVNWGYWGTVGIVASSGYQKRLEALGLFSISPQEGLEAMERLIGSPLFQVLGLRAAPRYLEKLAFRGDDRTGPVTSASHPAFDLEPKAMPALSIPEGIDDLNRYAWLLVWNALHSMGLTARDVEGANRDGIAARMGIVPEYTALFSELLDMLQRAGQDTFEEDSLAGLVAERERLERDFPQLKGRLELLHNCVDSYPQILTGGMNHMEAMFPGGSLHLVESIYRGDPQVDVFNTLVAGAVKTFVQKQLAADPAKVVTVLEVGAGTGGTSSFVAPALKEFGQNIRYIYTDISKSFTLHGKRTFGDVLPRMEFSVLDIETDPAAQGYDIGSVDVVFATNVIHATRLLADTLNHVKALLKRDGLFVLNELTNRQDFNTLTFGLTGGWWLPVDRELRIPGCPLLTPAGWRETLEINGFHHVDAWGVEALERHETRQHVMVSWSGGFYRSTSTNVETEIPRTPVAAPASVKAVVERRDDRDGQERLEEILGRLLAGILQIEADDVDFTTPFQDFGVDSLVAVEIVKKINQTTGVTLRSTDLFNYSTIQKLARHMVKDLNFCFEEEQRDEPVLAETPPARPTILEKPVPMTTSEPQAVPAAGPAATQEVAVIGMSCRFPDADDTAQFWRNLAEGKHSVREVPGERWDVWTTPHVQPEKGDRWGAFVENIDGFDPLFFNISPKEAEYMDPQQRILLQEAYRALEDAGYGDVELSEKKCCVFIGCKNSDYATLLQREMQAPDAYFFTGNASAILPAGISYYLNLRGPAVAVDTACSSSLVAIHLAYESILSGCSSMAIAGGVEIATTPRNHILGSVMGMASPTGVCRTFDDEADGFVAGEGAGVVVLKPLGDALRDRHHIYGVIKGSGLNQDGKSNGITAPSADSQTALECEVYDRFNIHPESIGYVEAHGTGTILGDPIEVDALTDAFRAYTAKKQFCVLGSVKANIGHALAAAGVAGFIKLLLMFKHCHMPPSLNYQTPNRHIQFEETPFLINTELRPWSANGKPRRAAVSSFGFSGTNAHIVLEEPLNVVPAPPRRPYYLVALSAKTEQALTNRFKGLLHWLEEGTGVSIADVAYTLLFGRTHFVCRGSLVVRDMEDLRRQLQALCADGSAGTYLFNRLKKGKIKPEPILRELGRRLLEEISLPELSAADYKEKVMAVADLYTKGYALDWNALFDGDSPRRVSLPTYPFDNTPFWLPGKGAQSQAPQTSVSEILHPMIHRNISTLARQGYSSRFTGNEFFLGHHVVAGQRVLPGVCYMEMARKAGELAGERPVAGLSNLMWANPVIVDGSPKEVNIFLTPSGSSVEFEVASAENGGPLSTHMKGKLAFDSASQADPLFAAVDLDQLTGMGTEFRGNDLYDTISRQGIDYGPAFRPIQWLQASGSTVLAQLELPASIAASDKDFFLHPSLMDGALQSVVGLPGMDRVDTLHVPFSMGEVLWRQAPGRVCYALATIAAGFEGKDSNIKKFHIRILDEGGNVAVVMKDFSVRAYKPAQPSAPKTADSMYFTPSWTEAPMRAGVTGSASTPVVVFSPHGAKPEYNDISADIITVVQGEGFESKSERLYEINRRSPKDFAQLVEKIWETGAPPNRFVFQWPMAAEGEDVSLDLLLQNNIYALFYLTQALLAKKPKQEIRLLVTYPASGPPAAVGSAVSGFARSLFLENSKFKFKTVALADDIPFGRLLQEFSSSGDWQWEVAYRDSRRWELKNRELPVEDGAGSGGVILRSGGVYLISGGTGGLGLIFARYLAERFKARLVLTDLKEPDARRAQQLEELKALGAEVEFVRADIGSPEDVKRLVGTAKERFGKIDGIIHSAGVNRDSFLFKKTEEQLSQVLAPKVYGAYLLDHHTTGEPLDFFVVFSSVAALMGNLGQSDYAFANRFLDGFTAYRNQLTAKGEREGAAISINWPLWKDGGMQVDEQKLVWLKNTLGIAPLQTEDGIRGFERALRCGHSQLAIVVGDRARIYRQLHVEAPDTSTAQPVTATASAGQAPQQLRREILDLFAKQLKISGDHMDPSEEFGEYGVDSIMIMSILNQLEERYGIVVEPNALVEHDTVEKLAAYLEGKTGSKPAPPEPPSPVQPAHHVEEELLTLFGNLLNMKPEDLDVEEEFGDYGVDSIMMMTALNRLEEMFGHVVDSNALVQYNTIQSLAAYLSDKVETVPPQPVVPIAEPRDRFWNDSLGKIAVIGMACRFPGAETIEAYKENLSAGHHLITEIPTDRWNLDSFYSPDKSAQDRSYSKWGGFISDPFAFDASYFNISDSDALVMDPQHRILLELTEELFRRAGYSREEMSGTRTGVYIGGGESPYVVKDTSILPDDYKKHLLVNTIQNMMAARISDFFNLKGPSQTVDTACSSSLVSVHQACKDIASGACRMAVAGGVELLLSPYLHVAFCKGDVLSDDGTCYVFDKKAKGITLGEGGGVVLLKSYDAAVRDEDNILAVVSGSAVNNDGHTMGLTVPNQEGQKDVIERALEDSGVTADSISYLEAHGTGTLLGDPIEIKAATQVFRRFTDDKQFCAVGSVKSNMGHLMRAAGIASFIKTVLSLEQRVLFPTLHCSEPHPRFQFDVSPFYPVTQECHWNIPGNQQVRRAGISSFGFGGTNCHMVLEEAAAGSLGADIRKPLPLPPFNRKYYRLGYDIAAVVQSEAFDGLALMKLLRELRSGSIDPGQAMSQFFVG
jgi:FkbH-like protein